MSNDPQRPPTGTGNVDDLQFDRVEAATPVPRGLGEPIDPAVETPSTPPPGVTVCAACAEPITDAYFEANGKVVCPRCREAVTAAQRGGSGVARFFKALVFGLGASVVSALVWWGIRAATGATLGIIAVFVGLFVGGAVKHGSDGRGGIGYRLLAALLTYLAIAGSWVPAAINQFRAESSDPVLIAVNTVVGSLMQPFIGASVIGWLIVGFALWEAIQINRSSKLVFNGPYRLAPGSFAPPPLPPA